MNSVLLWRRRESDKEVSPGKHGEFVDKDTNDLHLKLSDAMDHHNWREYE